VPPLFFPLFFGGSSLSLASLFFWRFRSLPGCFFCFFSLRSSEEFELSELCSWPRFLLPCFFRFSVLPLALSFFFSR